MKKIFFLVFISISINILGQDNCKFCDSLLQLQKQKWSQEIFKIQNSSCYKKDTTFSDTTYMVISKKTCFDGVLSYSTYSKTTGKAIVSFDVEDNDTTFLYSPNLQMPQYPGGEKQMMKFISKNIVYPKKEKEAGISGTCYVTFIVEKNGSMSNVKILRGVANGPGCDEAVLHIISLMPTWSPGKMNERPVRVRFNLPIKFTL